MIMHGALAAVLLAGTLLVAAPSAEATISRVFTAGETSSPGGIPCTVLTGANEGVRLCNGSPRSTVKTFDGTPIDVNVMFPPAPPLGQDLDYPAMGIFQGNRLKVGVNANSTRWLNRGYAVFTMSFRGIGESCGSAASRTADPAGCQAGYFRLADTRYEVRDAQYLLGLLADEGLIDPQRIGVVGDSNGAALAVALGMLRNRVMWPDGSLSAWESPQGMPMRIAAATPRATWTDLAYSIVPNGSALDYVVDSPYFGPQHRIGVPKQATIAALSAPILQLGFLAPEGQDPDADFIGWINLLQADGPLDGDPAAEDLVDEWTSHHSSYYIDPSVPPAPMLLANGWNDDVFSVQEELRLYNEVRAHHPNTPITIFALDVGHARSQSKQADLMRLQDQQNAWMDYYVKGVGPEPRDATGGVDLLTTTCPSSSPSEGPLHAESWADLAPGEIRFHRVARKTIAPTGTQFGPDFGATSGGPCGTTPSDDNPATANYRLDPAPAGGFTLVGSPTVIANFTLTGVNDQVAARLLDVDPGTNTQRLVSRALWRPEVSPEAVRQVFQLSPQAYKVEQGHVLKLELLPDDSPFGQANPTTPDEAAQHPVTVSNLQLRLPVQEEPCALGGLVQDPSPKVVPAGYQLATGFRPGHAETKCP